MSNLIEELRRGAEMEEEYDADGIVRIGYKRSLRYRAADEIERLRGLLREVLDYGASYQAAEYDEVQIPHELDKAISEALGDD